MGILRLALLASAMLSAPSAWAYSDDLPERSGIFTVKLAANKASYRVGELIELRITVVNRTNRDYSIALYPPYGLCRLVVRDGAGKLLRSSGQRGFVDWGLKTLDVPPRAAVVAKYPDPNARGATKEWFDLQYWGYHLRAPGKYAIRAIPEIEAFLQRPGGVRIGPAFTTSPSDLSNIVYITIRD